MVSFVSADVLFRTSVAVGTTNSSSKPRTYWPYVLGGCLLFLCAIVLLLLAVSRLNKREKENEERSEDENIQDILAQPSNTENLQSRGYDSVWGRFNEDVAPSISTHDRHQRREQSSSIETFTL